MLDKEISVPIHLLDHLEENPKGSIHGIYRAGLKTSLDYFNICDRLKVWPNPTKKGRYIVLNGNQRLPLIIEKFKHDLIYEHFNLNPEDEFSSDPLVSKEFKSRLRSIFSDPENEKLLQNFQVKAMQRKVDVQVMERLDKDDAKLFAATFDRNRAKYDEAKLVNNIVDEVRTKNQEIMRRMIRPEQAFIQPLPRTVPNISQPSPAHSKPLENAPEKSPEPVSERWGAPPPQEHNEKPAPAALIPWTISLTREGYKEITETTLRLNSRIYRENKIKESLEKLSTALGDRPLDSDSIIIETALLVINKHIEVAESQEDL